MKFNAFIDRMLKTNWTADLVAKYIGNYQESFFSYALDEQIRENAASGGSVTAILGYLLKSKEIDGALVCQSAILDGKVQSRFCIASSQADLMNAQGSKYITTHFAEQAIPLINDFDGRLAVVTLPCDAKILSRYLEQKPETKKKIALIITLFCGHISQPELTVQIVHKLRPDNRQLTGFRYRSGHWRGQLTATYEGSQPISKPFSYFSDYQNLYFFSERKCFHCFDHTGYHCDLSVGDIWLQQMKDNPVKHNALIVRTEAGRKIVNQVSDARELFLEQRPIEDICEGQSRSLKIHYNITARSKAGKIFKENIRDSVNEKVRCHDFAVAFLIMFNQHFSQSKTGRKIILHAPRPVIKLYLYFLKALEIL